MNAAPGRILIRVRGRVQGVGFRPSVWRIANELGLGGFVRNGVDGVTIEAEGPAERLELLLDGLHALPAPARVEGLQQEACEPRGESGFIIAESSFEGEPALVLLPDLVTCGECLSEILDPSERRYRYPFASCAICGPRYTIVEALPWDRSRTAMRLFPLCAACRAEYEDPGNRRFHAETIACPDCGPQLVLLDRAGLPLSREDAALHAAAEALRAGGIVALKGLGGYQLLCDARSAAAVAALRERKQRPGKPLALMVRDLDSAALLGKIDGAARWALSSRGGPIVLLPRRRDAAVAAAVAPGIGLLGVMLPTTPLHHLLGRELDFPLVCTSGNRSGEPLFSDDEEARAGLGGIADLFLGHDRPVVNPVDDSVVRIIAGSEVTIRCARGLAPLRIPAPGGVPEIAALGGDLKAAVALGAGDEIVLGPHVGDLENLRSQGAAERSLATLARLTGRETERLAVDAHPDWFAGGLARRIGAETFEVHHHHAHVLACVAEHDEPGPVLGVAWDGTGWGGDGTIWGGEFLLVNGPHSRRLAHLRRFRLPGGEQAVREPRRSMLGLLVASLGAEEAAHAPELARVFAPQELRVLLRLIAKGRMAPETSSAGRLFDGFAALLGLRALALFEGQAAMELESLAQQVDPAEIELSEGHHLSLRGGVLDWGDLLATLRRERERGEEVERSAALIHEALARGIADAARELVPEGVETVVLSGGCFQNARLTERALYWLERAGLRVLRHAAVPPNDGGLAVGQIAACRAERR